MDIIHFEKGLAKVKLEVAIFIEGDYYVAYSPALDLVGQGKDKEEAVESLMKTIKITLDWAMEKDTIYKLLLEHGWTLKEKPIPSYMPPEFNADDIRRNFNINKFETKKVLVYA